MTIRKTGAADGRITEVEKDEAGRVAGKTGLDFAASLAGPDGAISAVAGWAVQDEDGLAEENEAADLG
jgi:hypothetical protein